MGEGPAGIVVDIGREAQFSAWLHDPRQASERFTAELNTPIADPERPLEVLRTVHSFDPCLACAVHVVDGKGRSYGGDVVAGPESEGSTSLSQAPAAQLLSAVQGGL